MLLDGIIYGMNYGTMTQKLCQINKVNQKIK